MLFMKNVPNEEAEEGEVDDGSEPEDVDSDPQSPSDAFKFGHVRSSKSGNVGGGMGFKTKSKVDMRNGVQPSLASNLSSSNLGAHSVYNSIKNAPVAFSGSDMHDASSSPNQPPYSTEKPNAIGAASESDIPKPSLAHTQQAHFPFPSLTSDANTIGNSANVRLPGWPINAPSVPPGSLQEIEQMHKMYQKACELYEKAMEKINASGVKLPMGMLPRPPAPFVPLNVTIVPSSVTNTNNQHSPAPLASTLASGLLPPLPPPPSSLQTQQQQQSPSPNTLSSNSAYQAAYASAYQQTMKAIPAPQDGGPAPNTPEFGAMWQRYMDHYLRYYLRVSGITLPDQQQQQQAPSSTTPSSTTTTVITTTTTSNSSSKDEAIAAALMPTNPADIELPPSPKRSRSTETTLDSTAKNDDNTGTMDSEAKQKPSAVTTTQKIGQESANSTDKDNQESKATKLSLVDDTNASKYIWMSNLPQGVKAVDIKDRCTPFGRVQTIKIIGSRKSKPPSIYAYLIMETSDAAGRLIDGLQGAKFGDNEIKLKRINALPIP